MKTLILLVLSGVCCFGQSNDIQVITTAKTNARTGTIKVTDIFTRNGQTNLVRTTVIRADEVQMRMQKFYVRGLDVGEYVAMKDSSGFTTTAGIPYSASFAFGLSNEIKTAVVGTKDGVILDAFSYTNGLFYPEDGSIIVKANQLSRDMQPLFSPAHVTNTAPEDFGKEVEKFIQDNQR
jgi:hypothetical protein